MKKLNVGADASVRPLTQTGITLIALIITIIVMLILVGVTINVALNGGLFEKAKTASIQTEIAQIQEQLLLAKAVKIADNNGNVPENYGITLASLDLPANLKTKYNSKLAISADGTLHYIEDEVTSEEKTILESMGITANTNGESEDLGELVAKYVTAAMMADEDGIEKTTLELKAKGFTEEEISNIIESYKGFSYGENTEEDESDDIFYALVTLNNEQYLMSADEVNEKLNYIPKTNTALYQEVANLFVIENKLKTMFLEKTKDEITALGDLEKYIEDNITSSTINSVINDSGDSQDSYLFIINGYAPFHIQLSDNVCTRVILMEY